MPPELVGVWERVALTVDGATIGGAGRSFWFQGPSRFLDVRAAGAGLQSEAFAGQTSWDPETSALSWTHELDLHPGAGDDTGRVEWHGDDLIEHGSAATEFGVVDASEVWRRRSRPGAEMVVAERAGGAGRLATCGDRAVVLVDDRPTGLLRAAHLVDRGWAWAADLVLGPPFGPEAEPPDLTGTGRFGWLGRSWTVAERGAGQSSRPR